MFNIIKKGKIALNRYFFKLLLGIFKISIVIRLTYMSCSVCSPLASYNGNK